MPTHSASPTRPEQLSLLVVSELPVQFRLDQRTRLRGLAHIAEIRAQLATRHHTPDTAAVQAPVAARTDRAA